MCLDLIFRMDTLLLQIKDKKRTDDILFKFLWKAQKIQRDSVWRRFLLTYKETISKNNALILVFFRNTTNVFSLFV